MIYFIESQCAERHIKIGFARDIAERLEKLQTANAYQLVLLRALHGGLSVERDIHARFADARIRGEWFRATPELRAFIEATVADCLGPTPEAEPRTPDQHEVRLRRAVAARHRADDRWQRLRFGEPERHEDEYA